MAIDTRFMLRNLRILFRRFLRMLGMVSEPPKIEGLFSDCRLTAYESQDIGPWYRSCIRDNPATSDCSVVEVVWYKARGRAEHEALRFHISSPDKEHMSIVIAERSGGDRNPEIDAQTDTVTNRGSPQDATMSPATPPDTAVVSSTSSDAGHATASSADEGSPRAGPATMTNRKTKQKSTKHVGTSSGSSFKPPRGAHDRVSYATRDSVAGAQLEGVHEKDRRIRMLTFPERVPLPSANELATLLYVTSTLEPNYDIKETQCYWFAATVFWALKSLFEGVEQEIANHRAGTTLGMQIASIKDSVEPVCKRYKEARATLAEEIEQKRKAEQQQEEERRQERAQREAAEEAAKREREQRQAAEEERQRAEEERQREREQRQAAEDVAKAAEERARTAEEANAELRRRLEALERAGASTQQV
ncbi:hypothetical protein EDC04DRAFT_3142098 [Pisolithus marmoratus]|nr:hypothetical protein EDC04DRAFT_3142098 [Pisolithus marmoratus]